VPGDNIHLLPKSLQLRTLLLLEGFVLSSCATAGICSLYRKARATFVKMPASLLASGVTGFSSSLSGYINVADFRPST
jgi:hypothetical protein